MSIASRLGPEGDGRHGIPSDAEEVALPSNALSSEDLLPHPNQSVFDAVVILLIEYNLLFAAQRLAPRTKGQTVHLSGHGERQPLQGDRCLTRSDDVVSILVARFDLRFAAGIFALASNTYKGYEDIRLALFGSFEKFHDDGLARRFQG
ncbi:hypothetical protein HG530_015717 [Fusarium avenaceum]|nr:hypothetical protein HG530_015717 [Fusarium avenaceum]